MLLEQVSESLVTSAQEGKTNLEEELYEMISILSYKTLLSNTLFQALLN